MRICVECGKPFNPITQGNEEDVSCMECIDKRNMDDVIYTEGYKEV